MSLAQSNRLYQSVSSSVSIFITGSKQNHSGLKELVRVVGRISAMITSPCWCLLLWDGTNSIHISTLQVSDTSCKSQMFYLHLICSWTISKLHRKPFILFYFIFLEITLTQNLPMCKLSLSLGIIMCYILGYTQNMWLCYFIASIPIWQILTMRRNYLSLLGMKRADCMIIAMKQK